MNAQEIMSRPAITCRETDTLAMAAQRMWEGDCGVLPVVDDLGAIVGVITDRDVCMSAYTTGKALAELPVAHPMAKRVFSCGLHDDIADVERTMARQQVRRVPVVDEQRRVVGVVSMNDIARATAQSGKKPAAETLSTLAAICEPRRAMRRAA